MSTIQLTQCDWCGRKVRRDGRTDLYAIGWRSLSWCQADHLCPECVGAAKAAMKTARDACAGKPSTDDPIQWGTAAELGPEPETTPAQGGAKGDRDG
jgi:hypothetical protein